MTVRRRAWLVGLGACVSDMELGHILWPSDPVTRESSDPETQLTGWPCSIMNSKCRLMCRGVRIIDVTKKYSLAKEFLIIISKSKSSLHRLTSSDFSPTTDTWQWLLSFQHFKCTFCILGIFSKTGKTRVTHRVKMMTRWPGRERWPKWPIDPVTQWPSSMSGAFAATEFDIKQMTRHV